MARAGGEGRQGTGHRDGQRTGHRDGQGAAVGCRGQGHRSSQPRSRDVLGAWGNQRTPKAWGHPLSSLSPFPAPSQAGNVPGPRPAQPWCSPAPSVPAAGPSASAGASGSRPPRRGRPPACAGCRIAAGERSQGKETVKIPQERERKVTAPFFPEMDEAATSGQSRSRQARGSSLVCHHGMPDPDPPWPSKGSKAGLSH